MSESYNPRGALSTLKQMTILRYLRGTRVRTRYTYKLQQNDNQSSNNYSNTYSQLACRTSELMRINCASSCDISTIRGIAAGAIYSSTSDVEVCAQNPHGIAYLQYKSEAAKKSCFPFQCSRNCRQNL